MRDVSHLLIFINCNWKFIFYCLQFGPHVIHRNVKNHLDFINDIILRK